MLHKKAYIHHLWLEVRWIAIGIIWFISLLLGYFGFSEFSRENSINWSFSDVVYRTIQLIDLGSGSVDGKLNWMLEIARFLLPALTIYTIIQGLLHLFDKQMQFIRLWGLRNHIIVCGLGRKGNYIAKDLLKSGQKVVVIEKEISSEIAAEIQKEGGIVLAGDATQQDTLYSARLHRARYIVCMLGNDSLNLQVAFQAYHITRSRNKGRLTCTICLSSQGLFEVAKRNELFHEDGVPYQIESFNPYDRSARLLLVQDDDLKDLANSCKDSVHLLIVGWGRLGESLIIQAAHSWHLMGRKDKLIISVIDKNAQNHFTRLFRDDPNINQVLEINPIQIDIQSINLLQKAMAEIQVNVSRAYICLSDPILSLQVYQNIIRSPKFKNVAFRIRLAKDSGVSTAFESSLFRSSNFGKVVLFDLFEQTCTAEVVLTGLHEYLARELYESYYSETVNSGIGHSSMVPWDQLSNDDKNANLKQGDRLYNLLNSVGYTINFFQNWNIEKFEFQPTEIEKMASLEHTLWCQNKELEGWKFGNSKDNRKKTHPALISWDKLPEIEKEKDRRTIKEIPNFLSKIGFQIDKLEN